VIKLKAGRGRQSPHSEGRSAATMPVSAICRRWAIRHGRSRRKSLALAAFLGKLYSPREYEFGMSTMMVEVRPVESNGEFFVDIAVDGSELRRRGPFSADEVEAGVTRKRRQRLIMEVRP
jgi:hypothetical protein